MHVFLFFNLPVAMGCASGVCRCLVGDYLNYNNLTQSGIMRGAAPGRVLNYNVTRWERGRGILLLYASKE